MKRGIFLKTRDVVPNTLRGFLSMASRFSIFTHYSLSHFSLTIFFTKTIFKV